MQISAILSCTRVQTWRSKAKVGSRPNVIDLPNEGIIKEDPCSNTCKRKTDLNFSVVMCLFSIIVAGGDTIEEEAGWVWYLFGQGDC